LQYDANQTFNRSLCGKRLFNGINHTLPCDGGKFAWTANQSQLT
jgi:hypothetical protein